MECRKEHEQLVVMMVPTMRLDGVITMVKEASEAEKWTDVLNISVGAEEAWVSAKNAYKERFSKAENRIIEWLRDCVRDARDAKEVRCIVRASRDSLSHS